MLIHQVQVSHSYEKVLDPKRGLVQQKTERIGPGSAFMISDEDGKTYEADAGGTFDVPGEVAASYLRKDDWAEGPNPFAQEKEAEAEATAKKADDERSAGSITSMLVGP